MRLTPTPTLPLSGGGSAPSEVRRVGNALAQTKVISWSLSGNVRMRLPVAAKIAFSTAGAATKMVGSPTPPQKPPDGMMIVSTFGISAMRIEL